jgi:hypothetical protein
MLAYSEDLVLDHIREVSAVSGWYAANDERDAM